MQYRVIGKREHLWRSHSYRQAEGTAMEGWSVYINN